MFHMLVPSGSWYRAIDIESKEGLRVELGGWGLKQAGPWPWWTSASASACHRQTDPLHPPRVQEDEADGGVWEAAGLTPSAPV